MGKRWSGTRKLRICMGMLIAVVCLTCSAQVEAATAYPGEIEITEKSTDTVIAGR